MPLKLRPSGLSGIDKNRDFSRRVVGINFPFRVLPGRTRVREYAVRGSEEISEYAPPEEISMPMQLHHVPARDIRADIASRIVNGWGDTGVGPNNRPRAYFSADEGRGVHLRMAHECTGHPLFFWEASYPALSIFLIDGGRNWAVTAGE
jgi:hypothetical protein